MKLLKQYPYRQIVFYALVALLPILLPPSTSMAQDDSGPYPVEPLPDGPGVLIELQEGVTIERPGKLEVQPLTADPNPDQFILPDPGPAVPQPLPASLLEPLPETPSQPQQTQAMPDLIVVDIWSTTNPLQAGQEENVTFQIKNQGTADISTQFLIRFSIDGVAKAGWSSGGLAVGQVAQASTTVIINSTGAHEMKIEVDFDGRIAESNESNNILVESWTWAASPVDLVVVDIWSTTNPLQAGQEENVTFQIKNQGTAGIATEFLIRFSIDGIAKAAWSSGGLAAGQVAQASTTVIVNGAGLHEMKIEVDFDERIVESNESNNTRVEDWTWAASPVDLIVEDIWSATNPLRAGDVEDITYSVRNNGTAGVPVDFHAHVFVDGSIAGDSLISGLGSGMAATRSIAVTVVMPGPHDVEVIVDPDEKVPESNEANNGRAEVWNWQPGPVDLIVEDIWSTTNPLEAVNVEEIVYSIRNQGTAAVPVDFHAQLWIDGAPAGTSLISGLAAGASVTRAVEVVVIMPGLHVVEVIVDPAGVVPETDEGNNGRVENWQWAGEVLFLPVIIH